MATTTNVEFTTTSTHLGVEIAATVRRFGWRLAIAGSLLAPTPLWAADEPAEPAPIAAQAQTSEDAAAAFSEDSVLIARRKAEAAAAASESTLEPISQYADREPELADPKPAAKEKSKSTTPTKSVVTESKAAAASAPVEPIATAKSLEVEGDKSPTEAQPRPKPLAAKPAAKPLRFRVASRIDRTPTAADTDDVARAYEAESRPDPARFHGIVPGISTKADLIDAWGEAQEVSPTEAGELLLYEMPPFAAVDVMIEDGTVAFIKVELDNQQQPERLARRLRLDKFKPVEIFDEAENVVVGLAYPEKGMLLIVAKPTTQIAPSSNLASDDTAGASVAPPQFVTHMVIQPLDAEAFALRADQADFAAFEAKLTDLRQAIRINAENGYANWRMAQLYQLTGSSAKASKAAAAALKADSKSDAYRLCWAECLTDQGKYDQAVLEARKVLDSEDAPDVVKAGALHLMGRLAAMGESGIADKAIGFQNMAIDLADDLATSSDTGERRTAKRLLVDAHLAVARDISRRKYARKSEIVGQWIGRASGLAEDMISAGDGNLELRLLVARDALAALANLKPAKDPAPWIEEAEETAAKLLAENPDRLYRSRVEWQLGQAYFHALRVEHSRKQVELGMKYGQQAIRRLKAGAATGDLRPEAQSLIGRLYFHLGALQAVHRQDHVKAIAWYDKAEPLLNAGVPKSELAVPRRRGEALVSMAVSYWDQGQRDRAVELTNAGAELMEQAVAGGVLDEKSLAVPYGNLSTMHRRLGDRDASVKFAQLARGARGAETITSPSFAEAVTKAAQAKPQRTNASPRNASNRQQRQQTPAKQAAQPQRTPTSDRSAARSTGRNRGNSASQQQQNAPVERPRTASRRPSNSRKPAARRLYR